MGLSFFFDHLFIQHKGADFHQLPYFLFILFLEFLHFIDERSCIGMQITRRS